MASSGNEELAERVVVVAVQPELAAAACRPSSEATIPMEHGTSSAGPSTCDDPPDSSLTSPFLNAASPILCAPLQDTTLPLARASHVWLPAEEQWRQLKQLKPPTKRKQAVERPASGMAVGADAAGVPVSRRGPVADALPPGWVCDEHVSSSGIHYKRYRGPYGQRAQSVRDAWRKVEGEAEAREAGKEAGAGAGAAPHGGEPPAATAKATLSLAVRDDGTGRAMVAATVRASARARKQRSDKGKKRGPRAPAGAAGDAAAGGAAVDFALGPPPQGALAPGDAAAVPAKAEEKAARRAARRAVAAVLDGLVRQVEREHGPPPAEGAAARSSAASSSDAWSAGRGPS